MQPLRLKTLPVIFVAVQDLTLIVSGKTRQRCKALGFEGYISNGIGTGRIGTGRSV